MTKLKKYFIKHMLVNMFLILIEAISNLIGNKGMD